MPRADASRRRCAIYTRKSSEEGLEQEFNSLAAQREACEAYIRSQQHEGWLLARNRYDDGGFSGGNLERPAAQRLLTDIRAGRIDIVVVYKVDRLTRSLADFARLVELFDAEAVSFVSVTQQFNTTSSMGRLTLNVLLSFAQFEREVTGERIRDKIAASKKKGMWMGGNVPLGYDASERTLVINPAEAETVRRVFALYRELGCVRRVKEAADRLGLRTKCSTTRNGTERGGKPFSRGHLYTLLSNPIYTGHIAHKGELHPGQQAALIDDESWSTVRDQLAANTSNHRRRAKAAEPSLLAGLLVDARGERLTPSHAVKKGRRYRYYVSAALITDAGTDREGWRLAAREIEEAVIRILADALTSPASLVERFGAAGMPSDQVRKLLSRAARMAAALGGSPGERAKLVRELVEKIIVDEKTIIIKLRRGLLLGEDVASSASRGAGWTVHAMPCHHAFAEALRAFIDAAGIAEDRKGWLFRTERGHKADALSERAMNQSDAWCMIRRHAAAAGITAEIGCHTFRATGITAYLANGGALEHAQEMAGYESPRGKGVIDAVLDQHAVGADAGLADIPVFRGDRALDRHFDIGVVKDDERRVSAQLE